MGYKILLADDSVTVQKIITLTFSDEGVDVLTVNSGNEAIHRLQYLRPALVMADVSLPGKNGYEICEFVKTHPEMADTPVILLAPAFEPFDEERAKRIGADQHLIKPFQSIRTLISTVKGLLEKKVQATIAKTPSGGLRTSAAPTNNIPPATPPPVPQPVEPIPAAQPLSVEPIAEPEVELLVEPDATQADPQPQLPADDFLLELDTPPPAPQVTETRELVPVQEPPVVIEEPFVIIPELEIVIDPEPEPTPAPVQVEAAAIAQVEVDDEWDDVLDLDDLWVTPSPQVIAIEPVTIEPVVEPTVINENHTELQPVPIAFPQEVIDEIVNRIVTQLSAHLENLGRELARQLAPEVAQVIKQQRQPEPVLSVISPPHLSFQEADSLLDLD